MSEFEKLGIAHEKFHKLCAATITVYYNHKTAEDQNLPEIQRISDEVIGYLDAIKKKYKSA
ncbi:hypothetical protein AXE86_09415 [Selenomonas sp. oral taxon 136]|nr:hypothetical protein AXE86_09415 [Selenomonas sp. oral taxon 136]